MNIIFKAHIISPTECDSYCFMYGINSFGGLENQTDEVILFYTFLNDSTYIILTAIVM